MTDKPSGAKTEVCLFKQKTRLARIRATKIRGTNAYMRYKQNGLLIDSLEEVTGPSGGRGLADACMPLCSGAMPPHTGEVGRCGGALHALTQGLLSFQCFSVIVVSLTSHLSAAALTCFLNSLSIQQESQAGTLAFWWSTAITVTLTHDQALHVCPTGFGGEGGTQRLTGQ